MSRYPPKQRGSLSDGGGDGYGEIEEIKEMLYAVRRVIVE